MRIVEAGGSAWAINLKWETAQKSSQLSKLKARAKQRKFNVFFAKGKVFGCAKVEDKADKRALSKNKVVALAALIGQVYTNKIVTVSDEQVLGAGRYWTALVRDGVVVPGTDIEHPDSYAAQDHMERLHLDSIYPDADLHELILDCSSFDELIQGMALSPAVMSTCCVTTEGAVSKQQALALLGIACAGAYYAIDSFTGPGGPSPEEIAAQERANAVQQYQQALTQIQSVPALGDGWAAFSALMNEVPIAVGQYVVTKVECEFQMQSCTVTFTPDQSLSVTTQMDYLVAVYKEKGGTVAFSPDTKVIDLTLPLSVDLAGIEYESSAVFERVILDTVMMVGGLGSIKAVFSGASVNLNQQYIQPGDMFMTGQWEISSASPAYALDAMNLMERGRKGALRLNSLSYDLGNQIVAKGSYVVR